MEWKTVKLGEIITIKYGKDHKALGAGNVPVYGSGGIMRYADKAIYDKPSILIPRKGSLNNIFYVDKPFWTVDTMFWSIIDTEKADPHFLFYAICKLDFAGLNVGSAVPSLTVPVIEAVELPLPPIETQRRIAAILSSLDDKIENNNRINRNLEAQAQALFKSWFVDFEPWGGTMPEDWKEGTLGEIAEFKRGKGILGKDARPGNVPVVAGGMEPAYYHDTANTKAPVITISASGANAGFVRLYYEDVWASDCSWIDASSKNLLWVYCYLSMNRHILRHAQTGAVQPHVKAKDVNAFEIIVPAQDVIEDFINAVKPLFKQIANNQEENDRLATLRDTLLPKLMKGDIAL